MATENIASNTEGAVTCSAWLGVSARSQRILSRAAAAAGLEIAHATWEPIRNGGIMCGHEGGWVVEVRVAGTKRTDYRFGDNIEAVIAQFKQAAGYLGQQEKRRRAESPSGKHSDTAR
jgi:hypothetical protein